MAVLQPRGPDTTPQSSFTLRSKFKLHFSPGPAISPEKPCARWQAGRFLSARRVKDSWRSTQAISSQLKQPPSTLRPSPWPPPCGPGSPEPSSPLTCVDQGRRAAVERYKVTVPLQALYPMNENPALLEVDREAVPTRSAAQGTQTPQTRSAPDAGCTPQTEAIS